MNIIITATDLETKLAEKWLKGSEFALASKFNYDVVQSEIGRTNTMLTLCDLVKWYKEDDLCRIKVDHIVNIGLCGSNRQQDFQYDLIIPENFKDGDRDWTCNFTKDDMYPMTTHHLGPTLVTTSKFFKTDKGYDNNLYDMEAFDIYAFCENNDIQFSCFKIVSDDCSSCADKIYTDVDEDKVYNKFKEALDGCEWK